MSVDLMTGASRGELIEWINSTLHLRISKIEETASGAVACQIIDMLHPETVPMHKVNFAAKDPYEFNKNYKVLQSAFARNHINKTIDVERLMKARPQDNLEFMQWLKKYFDQHNVTPGYNPEERRSSSRGGREATASTLLPALSQRSSSNTSSPSKTPQSSLPSTKRMKVTAPVSSSSSSSSLQQTAVPKRVAELEKEMIELRAKLNEACGDIQKQKLQIKDLEGERDFYNQKLVSIDEFIHSVQEDSSVTIPELVQKITDILYAESTE